VSEHSGRGEAARSLPLWDPSFGEAELGLLGRLAEEMYGELAFACAARSASRARGDSETSHPSRHPREELPTGAVRLETSPRQRESGSPRERATRLTDLILWEREASHDP